MPREDYYYCPIPYVMIRVLDKITEEEGRRYGIDNRAEIVRAILGDFIDRYDQNGQDFRTTRRKWRNEN
jgi:hypothetical protein